MAGARSSGAGLSTLPVSPVLPVTSPVSAASVLSGASSSTGAGCCVSCRSWRCVWVRRRSPFRLADGNSGTSPERTPWRQTEESSSFATRSASSGDSTRIGFGRSRCTAEGRKKRGEKTSRARKNPVPAVTSSAGASQNIVTMKAGKKRRRLRAIERAPCSISSLYPEPLPPSTQEVISSDTPGATRYGSRKCSTPDTATTSPKKSPCISPSP